MPLTMAVAMFGVATYRTFRAVSSPDNGGTGSGSVAALDVRAFRARFRGGRRVSVFAGHDIRSLGRRGPYLCDPADARTMAYT